MGIAQIYKDGEVVFFSWLSEGDTVSILSRKEDDGEGRKSTMTKKMAREYWKNLQEQGFRG